jgi:hypothetical protein
MIITLQNWVKGGILAFEPSAEHSVDGQQESAIIS